MSWLDYRISNEKNTRSSLSNFKINGSFYKHVNKRLSNGRCIDTNIHASGSPVTNDNQLIQ